MTGSEGRACASSCRRAAAGKVHDDVGEGLDPQGEAPLAPDGASTLLDR
jgi:hypothetical protein